MKPLIVLPTYNEAENIVEVLDRAREAVPEADVLVVDDGSPDGTADIAERWAAEHGGGVSVLRRAEKSGLGSAYRAGFATGLAQGYDALIEMDSDLSHDPAALPALISAVDSGADLAIGSRYVPGGAIPDWPKHREYLSRSGNLYARLMLGLQVRDATSGFRCYAGSMLSRIDLDEITADGYGFQIEMAYAVARRGGRIVEVPISFTDRVRGTSKMSGRIVVEALVLVTWWAFRDRVLQSWSLGRGPPRRRSARPDLNLAAAGDPCTGPAAVRHLTVWSPRTPRPFPLDASASSSPRPASTRGLSLEEVAARTPFAPVELGRFESGDQTLPSSERDLVVGAYGVTLDALVPGRAQVVVDLEAGELVVAGERVRLARDPGPDEVLAAYLSLVYTLRRAQPGRPIVLRAFDVAVLARGLDLARPEVDRRLRTLMVEPVGAPPAVGRRRRRLVLLVGTVVAVAAIVLGVMSPRFRRSRPSGPDRIVDGSPAGAHPTCERHQHRRRRPGRLIGIGTGGAPRRSGRLRGCASGSSGER